MSRSVEPFRFTGLWQWNPVSCVGPRSYDERHMARQNEWFFDRALMRRYFESMRAAGLNTWVLANTHPFPFMVDLKEYPDASELSAAELGRYQAHYHWLFETARGFGVQPFVLFHTCYVPDRLAEARNIRPTKAFAPPQVAYEYTRCCVRRLCETYPELAGVHAEASENMHPDRRAAFAREAIVGGIHESGRRPVLFFRGWVSDPAAMRANVLDAYRGECFFTVKYTWEFLIGAQPDPEFLRWTDACGPGRVLPEFWISNYQPFGCHDVELAAALRRRIRELGCPGWTSHPMDLYGAPFVQGADRNVLQLDRDRDWFATLSGAWADGASDAAARFGSNAAELAPAMRAASRPSQQISFYMTGNKQNFLQPQLLAAVGGEGRCAYLQTAHFWSELPGRTDGAYGRWMAQLEGRKVLYPTEAGAGYGLRDLIAELDQLEAAWREPPAQAPRDHDVYLAWRRDLIAQHLMARAWVERARAMLARFQGASLEKGRKKGSDPLRSRGLTPFSANGATLGVSNEAARPHLESSLSLVRRVPEALGTDGPYRLLVGRHTFVIYWHELVAALEKELADWGTAREDRAYPVGVAEFRDVTGGDFVERGEKHKV